MLKFTLLFFILFYNFAYAEVVKKINITGNDRISAATISVYGDIEINKDFTKKDVNNVLKNLYETNFFEDISINLQNGVLNIKLKEYPILNSLLLEGEKSKKIKDKLKELMSLKKNGSFIKAQLKQDIGIIKKAYGTLGYNFTKVEAKVENFSKNRLNLILIIDKGNKTSIKQINFIGDKKLSDRRLRDIIVSSEDKIWKFLSQSTHINNRNIDLDKRLLQNYYKSIGYYDAQVLSSSAEVSSTKGATLTYNINAGTRYKVTKITTNVSPVFDRKIFLPLQKDFNKVIGKYYSPFKVKKLLDGLDILINDNDLQFVEHSVNEILDNDSIEIIINVTEGNKELVERINVKGNTVTNDSVIRGELLLDEGDPFNKLKLSQSISRLKGRGIFGEVNYVVTEGSEKDLKIIELSVEEKPTGEISAGAGIGTSGGSFSFNITENNWLGKGIQLSTFIDVGAESLEGSIQAVDPNYNFSGNALTYSVSSTRNDVPDSGYENTMYQSSIGTKFEQYRNIYISPSVSLAHDTLRVENKASASLKKQAGTFTDLSFSYGVSLDERDRKYMPSDGYISSFNQSIPIYADSAYIKNSYAYNQYNAFGPNIIGAAKFYVAAINGLNDDDVRINKRLFMPPSKIRGFKKGGIGPVDGKKYVGGNYNAALNFETALPNLLPESTKTDIGLFLDMANVWGVDYDDNIANSNKIRAATGVNVGWSSPLGPMTFVFAQNLLKADTDQTESFNFRLGTSF